MQRMDQFGIALAQGPPVDVDVQPQRIKRAALIGGENHAIGALGRAPGAGPPGNGFQRIGEIGPARRRIDPGGWRKCAGLPVPAVDRMLRRQNLFRAHPVEPIIPGVELAHVIKAEPAILARPVETRSTWARRAKFAVVAATRPFAQPAAAADPSMKTILFHRFHMAIVRLEEKS